MAPSWKVRRLAASIRQRSANLDGVSTGRLDHANWRESCAKDSANINVRSTGIRRPAARHGWCRFRLTSSKPSQYASGAPCPNHGNKGYRRPRRGGGTLRHLSDPSFAAVGNITHGNDAVKGLNVKVSKHASFSLRQVYTWASVALLLNWLHPESASQSLCW